MILGDNIFYGDNLRALLRDTAQQPRGATVFACWVDDPERYGVIEFDATHRPLRIVEKPKPGTKLCVMVGLSEVLMKQNQASRYEFKGLYEVQSGDTLKSLGSDARIEFIEGRDHFDLYEGGLAERIAREMYAVARPQARRAASR